MTAAERRTIRNEISRRVGLRVNEFGPRMGRKTGPRLGPKSHRTQSDSAARLAESLTMAPPEVKPKPRNRWLPGQRIRDCIYCGCATYRSLTCPGHRDLLEVDA